VDSDFLQGVKKVFGSDEKKEFVDPYFHAGFAGTKVCVCFFSSVRPTLQSELKVKKWPLHLAFHKRIRTFQRCSL